MKPTTPKNCIFMPFVDTNSHLTTKPNIFDIKCQSNYESHDQHSFFGTNFRGGQNFLLTVGGFSNKRECSGADWLDPLVTFRQGLSLPFYFIFSQMGVNSHHPIWIQTYDKGNFFSWGTKKQVLGPIGSTKKTKALKIWTVFTICFMCLKLCF